MDWLKKNWGVLLVVGVIFTAIGFYVVPEFILPGGEETGQVVVVQQPTGGNVLQTTNNVGQVVTKKVPIETLKANAKNKYTMASASAGSINFYASGADVTDPYVRPLDDIQITTGSGETSNYVIQTGTAYDVYYNGSSTYYDIKLSPSINYNEETGKGFLLIGGQSYVPLSPIGTFVNVSDLPEVQSCMNDTTTNRELTYVNGSCSDSGWFRVDIGNSAANTELQDVVMCFKDTGTGLEGNEITAFTASYVSGSTKITIPGALQSYWNDAAGTGGATCITIATSLGSSEKARWQFDMTVSESEVANDEYFDMVFDDLGDYAKKQYPSRNAKATAETLRVNLEQH